MTISSIVIQDLRFSVVKISVVVSWLMMACGFVGSYQYTGGIYHPHLQRPNSTTTQKITTDNVETSVQEQIIVRKL
jgi:hypothetical protein